VTAFHCKACEARIGRASPRPSGLADLGVLARAFSHQEHLAQPVKNSRDGLSSGKPSAMTGREVVEC